MEQGKLFFEDLEEALRDTIRALGGPKAVGHQIKPEMKPDAAGRWLNDTLNDARTEVLSYRQFVLIAQMGRHAGIHNVATQFMRECNYGDPVPVEPDDEAAQLQKEFIVSIERAGDLVSRLEKLRDLPQLKAVRKAGA